MKRANINDNNHPNIIQISFNLTMSNFVRCFRSFFFFLHGYNMIVEISSRVDRVLKS